MRSCCYEVTERNWIIEQSLSNKSRRVGYIGHKKRSYTVSYLSKALEINIS